MKTKISVIFCLSIIQVIGFSQPIQLHPINPHYLSYKGNSIILISSAEHYGAVLNEDFDFIKYLETLQNEGMNYTRIFTGSYVEIPGSFGIQNNTLAPKAGRYLTPWKRTDEPGLYQGENKVDLTQWNQKYFERLHNFIAEAEKRNVIVEITFFCSTYQDAIWVRNPFNPGNNINNLKEVNRKKSNTLENGNLTTFQKELVKKIVTELNDYDNVFYEIQNEPWSDDPQKAMKTLRTLDPEGLKWTKWSETASEASLEWQKEIAEAVAKTESSLPKKHLIAQNYFNFKHSLTEVDPNVSILNFHYAWPEAVWLNYGWELPINFDESGFAEKSDTAYLRQAWQFMLAGGAIFNNLDYSFFTGAEDGKGKNIAPGGGSTNFRKQLNYLHNFLESFDYISMKPDFDIVYHSPGAEWQALSENGKQYAVFLSGIAVEWVKLKLPKGEYNYEFVSPFTSQFLDSGELKSSGEIVEINVPEFVHLIALKIKKRN